mmetsp:Transcript_1310/g.1825  ORF Transcript_1310/g.1825 Transcript_1310/m.1825 type:complete len:144 (-) Transcript_1310:162-593(-)
MHQEALSKLHSQYCLCENTTLPWGGDIPPAAQRFFSPYAVWTRLSGDDGLNVLKNDVWDVFVDYLDLYIDLMKEVVVQQQNDDDDDEIKQQQNTAIQNGHTDYLNYRRANDPARPMLRSLYGEEWTERLIEGVLFPMLSFSNE